MTTPTRRWLRAHLPPGLLRLPDEFLIALLCLMSGSGALSGEVRVDSAESLLPEIIYRAWGLVLVLGGLALMAGIFSIRRVSPTGYMVHRAAVYRLGQRLLFTGGLAYATCVAAVAGAPGIVGAVVAFSLARGIRLLMLKGDGYGMD